MKTNKFTTQKLFCTLLFNLLVMGAFAQFTPNAAGAPDEPIPEPEVEGTSCETAYQLNLDEDNFYTAEEEQEKIFIEFIATTDSIGILFDEVENSEFKQAKIYQLNNCESLILHYSKLFNEVNGYSHINLTSLTPDQVYLIELERNDDAVNSSIEFNVNTIEAASPFCPNFSSECGEKVKNGGFEYVDLGLVQFNSNGKAEDGFFFGGVCKWESFGSADMFNKSGEKFAYMVCDTTGYSETIGSYVSLDPGGYIFSIDLASSHAVWQNIPKELRLVLYDTTNNTDTIIAVIDSSQIQRRLSSTDVNFPTRTACFQIDKKYDAIGIYPAISPFSNSYASIFIDNVSIKDAGADEDIEVTDICSYPLIDLGPDSNCFISGADYLWSPYSSNVLGGVFSPNISVYPFETETYTLTISNLPGTNCILTDEVTIKLPYDHYLYNADALDLFTKVGDSSASISNRIFRIEGTLTLDTSVQFTNCSFYMGEDAKIVINNNASVVFLNSKDIMKEEFFTSCSPDKYWDGIYQTGGSGFHILGRDGVSGVIQDTIYWRISNSKNGINLVDAEEVYMVGTHFENNGKALAVENTNSNTTNAIIQNLKVECTQALNYGSGDFYPQTAIELKNIRTSYRFDNFGNTFEVKHSEINSSGGNMQLLNSEATIGNVDFNGFNNYYQFPGEPDKSDKAIVAYGGDANAKLKISYSSFVGNRESIRIQDQYSVEVSNNYVNSAGIPDASFLRATDVSNLSTIQGSNLNLISNNTILNVKKGVELYSSTYFRISNNYFDMEVQPDSNYYTKNNNEESVAIYANDYMTSQNPKYPPDDYLTVEGNTIKHSKVGIHHEFVWSSITNNVIKDLNNRFTPPQTCFPIQNPCPITPSYGIRAMNDYVIVNNNLIENDLSQYSGTMPNSQEKMIGISMENVHTPLLTPNSFPHYSHFYCNATESTGIGIRIAGFNDLLDIRRNRMQDNKIGLALDNEAYIMDVGTDIYGFGVNDAANEWVGFSLNNPHTFNFSNDNPNNPPKYYYKGTGPQIGPFDASAGYKSIKDTLTSNDNIISCTAPLMVDNSSDKKEATTAYNKSGKKPRWMQKKNASDSAFYLRQQLQFYHLSKDSALYNSQQFSNFRDSMKNTALGRALGKNSQAMRSLSAQSNFDQNVSTVEPLLDKHFSDSILSSSELDQLRQIAVLCPYTDGIAVYQARRVLHEYGERLYVNKCEISQLPNNQKFIRIKAEEKQDRVPFAIYPNPADEQINISYSVEKDEEIVLEIYDVLGKRIMTKSLNSGHLHQINTSQLQHGVYIYRLFKSKEQINNGKLVIE